jgi:hypothetical protein
VTFDIELLEKILTEQQKTNALLQQILEQPKAIDTANNEGGNKNEQNSTGRKSERVQRTSRNPK